jgi:hypothetical protein
MTRELGTTAPGGEDARHLERRATKALFVIGVLYGSLVATHGGEFWPFSVFPMFSRAGKPWARALIRSTPGGFTRSQLGAAYSLGALPGEPVALVEHGIPQNDLSSLAQAAERWGATELATLELLFGSLPCEQPLLLLRVRAVLADEGIHPIATPVASLGCNGADVEVHLAPLSSAALPR